MFSWPYKLCSHPGLIIFKNSSLSCSGFVSGFDWFCVCFGLFLSLFWLNFVYVLVNFCACFDPFWPKLFPLWSCFLDLRKFALTQTWLCFKIYHFLCALLLRKRDTKNFFNFLCIFRLHFKKKSEIYPHSFKWRP